MNRSIQCSAEHLPRQTCVRELFVREEILATENFNEKRIDVASTSDAFAGA
jgi:hypothetical protein